MFNYPDTSCDAYMELRSKLSKGNLRLWAAADENRYLRTGSNYAVYCRFSNTLLYGADSLQEIADYFRIGCSYD